MPASRASSRPMPLGELRAGAPPPARFAASWARRSASALAAARASAPVSSSRQLVVELARPREPRRAGSRRPRPRACGSRRASTPGSAPPTSAWCARLAAKPIRLAVREHRRDDRDVRQVGPAAEGVVEDPGVAGAWSSSSTAATAAGIAPRWTGMCSACIDHLAAWVEQRGGGVAALLDVGRVGGADEHHAHLVAGRAERAEHHLERDRVHHARSRTVARLVQRAMLQPAGHREGANRRDRRHGWPRLGRPRRDSPSAGAELGCAGPAARPPPGP